MKDDEMDIPRELLSSADHFLEIFSRIGLHWWYLDNREKKLTISPGLMKILGHTEGEYDPLNPSIYKHVHPDDIFNDMERMSRLLDGEDHLYESEFRVRDQQGGDWKWYYNRGSILSRDENGQGVVIGGVTMDVSQKFRQLISKAQKSERLYKTFFDAAEDAIGLFSVDGELILINAAFKETFGYNKEEFLDLGWMETIHPEDRAEMVVLWKELVKNGSLSMDFRVRHKSGQFICVSSKSVYIPGEGEEPEMIMTVIRDITERKEAMRELELAKEKAEESDKLKSAFLANMSHEIRTPMNSIVGFSNLLVNPGLDEAARAMYVERIVRNSELLLALISDIIDLAKIESNQLTLVYGKQNITVLLEEMRQYAEDEVVRLKRTGIKIITDGNDSDCEIEIDVNRLSQVMKNLVNNAIKFTESGIVRIGCRVIDSDQKVILFVEDSGVGISPENFEVIFNQFRQVDGSNTRKFGGTGLGLAICKNLVDMMGGRIWVESSEGSGSLFQVELPRKALQVQASAQTGSADKSFPAEGKNRRRVLVVDDEKDSLDLFHEILSGMGYDVLRATSGYEALQHFEEDPKPDLVFMDDQMSVLSGTETMRIIKDRYDEVKVVAQSAHALVGDGPRFLKEGFDGYLPKPFSIERLKDILSLFPSNNP